MKNKPIHYLQYDSRWGSIMFSNHGDKKQTIASSGCGAASSAMVLATFCDPAITPEGVAYNILEHGKRTYSNGVDWSWFPVMAQLYGLQFEQTGSTDKAIQAIRDGALVVASMGPGYFTSFGHYIMLWGLDEANKQVLVNDPNSTVRTKASYDVFKQQSSQYFIFRKDDGPVEKIKIIVEGKEIDGFLINDRAYAPVKDVVDAMNNTVKWDDATRTVTVS
jgi:hypothetical protein